MNPNPNVDEFTGESVQQDQTHTDTHDGDQPREVSARQEVSAHQENSVSAGGRDADRADGVERRFEDAGGGGVRGKSGGRGTPRNAIGTDLVQIELDMV